MKATNIIKTIIMNVTTIAITNDTANSGTINATTTGAVIIVMPMTTCIITGVTVVLAYTGYFI